MITIDEQTRAGRMMAAGRVTVTFKSPSGQHITVTAKARKKDGERWVNCPAAEAMIIFIEVPGADGGWADKVGKITRRGFQPDARADEARIFCAKQLIRFLAGEALPTGLEAYEEERCGKCGRALTDPVSIQRGIGPECYGQMTGSSHQTKVRPERASTPVETLEDASSRHEAEPYGITDLSAIPGFRSETERTNRGDGKDKQGVAFGHGDWKARKEVVRQTLAADQPAEQGEQLKLKVAEINRLAAAGDARYNIPY